MNHEEDQEVKNERIPTGPEVSYTVQTHFDLYS